MASSLLLKPFPFTKGFRYFSSCQWLYLGNDDSLLSVYDTRTWQRMFSCIFHGQIQGLRCSIIKKFQVKIIHNLSPHFWHNSFQEPHTFPGTQLGPGLYNYYILASSVSNFSPLNALFLPISLILPVLLIMWEVLLDSKKKPHPILS